MQSSFQLIGAIMLPAYIATVLIFGLIKKVKVFDVFIVGANEGLQTVIRLMPTLIGIMVAVELLSSSGITDFLAHSFKNICEKIGFPSEIIPYTLLRPISGSGSTILFNDILLKFGPDSMVGRIASIMAGSTETTFYAVSVYYQTISIVKTRHTLFCALAADFTAIFMSIILVRLIF